MSPVTALILAGGRATRMDGRDKGLLKIGDETFISRLTRQLQPQVESIVINANRHQAQYAESGFPVLEDTVPDFQGPLAGMLTGLNAISGEWLLTLPCDGPFVADDYAGRMVDAVEHSGHRLAVASDGTRLQPVYALIHRSLAGSLAGFLGTGDRKIDRWYAQHPYDVVNFADYPDMFINVNTPEDLVALQV